MLLDMRHRLAAHIKAQPDLSFFPESVFVDQAAGNPTAFGEERKAEIAALVDIADLQLRAFADAQAALKDALASSNPWHRYWALIACSRFGDEAKPLVETISALAGDDPERLVRVRAAECLGLLEAGDPRPTLRKALADCKSPTEALIILNTATLLHDRSPGYPLTLSAGDLSASTRDDATVQRRLQYLNRPAVQK